MPLRQLLRADADETLAQPRSRGDAVRTTECAKTHVGNDIACDTRAESELHAIDEPTGSAFDDIRSRLELSAVAGMIEMIDHQGGIATHR